MFSPEPSKKNRVQSKITAIEVTRFHMSIPEYF